jgi:predicted Zn finger-like uncharacterized protein
MITDFLQGKACPDCGSREIERVDSLDLEITNIWAVKCKQCGKEWTTA